MKYTIFYEDEADANITRQRVSAMSASLQGREQFTGAKTFLTKSLVRLVIVHANKTNRIFGPNQRQKTHRKNSQFKIFSR